MEPSYYLLWKWFFFLDSISCPSAVFCEIHVNMKFILCCLFVQKEDEPVAKKKKTEGSTEIGML